MINQELINKFKKRYQTDPVNQAVASAVSRVGINEAAFNTKQLTQHPYVFSEITDRGKTTNQKQSGRCWMFAALNAARVEAIKKYNLESAKYIQVDTIEFSENYTFFWDKFERANYFLDSIIDTVDRPVDDRLIRHLLADPMQDGGQWDMFAGILEKYGIVPKEAMPETFHSSNSSELRIRLTSYLRYFAYQLRQEKVAAKRAEMKEEMLYTIYNVLTKALGEVPTEVTFEYRDKDHQFHRMPSMTPQEFFKQVVGWKLEDKISLINAPTADKPYGKAYTIKYLGSVKEGRPIRYINTPIEVLKEAAIAAIKDNNPVWFGSDVGAHSNREAGIMDTQLYNYEKVLGTELPWTKAQRLEYSESMLTHAMVLVGVNLDDNGRPLTWEVENSWGPDRGKKGIYSMSDAWFDEFVYQIMVDKSYVDAKWLKALEEPVVELEPWDPIGTLAL